MNESMNQLINEQSVSRTAYLPLKNLGGPGWPKVPQMKKIYEQLLELM